MPNEPYVEEIMVADGDGDHPSTEEVKYEDTQISDDVIGVKGNDETSYRNGHVNLTQDNIVGNNDTANISDSDLIIFKKASDSKWYRKAFSKIWDYIKTKGDKIWLEKTKYNYNRELKLGSGTHYILIGEFPCYDHNITIEISTCYGDPRYATAVMATRNINTTGAGTINWKCYDPDNKITGHLYAKYVNGSRNIAIYYVTEGWPELLIRIQFQGDDYGSPLNIVKEVNELPAEATIRPTNVYGSSPKFTDTTYDAMTSSELSTGTATTLRTMRADYAKDGIKQLMLDMCYPVGSVYISTKNVSPATFLGGTWIQHNDYTLYATNSSTAVKFNTAAKDGGANSITLTGAQSGLKGHGHGFTQPTVNGGATNTGGMSANNPHNHGQDSHNHSLNGGWAINWGNGTYTYINASMTYGNQSINAPYASQSATNSKTPGIHNKDIAHTHSQVAHTHSVSGGKVTDAGASNASSSHSTIPNYKFVYMWERTA